MAETRRGKPYVWVTWITKLLGGQQQCAWASWFKARFKYEKLEEGSFDSAAWSARHAELVRRRAAELGEEGWAVTLENENGFKLEGRSGVLSGKPDIVARRDAAVRVNRLQDRQAAGRRLVAGADIPVRPADRPEGPGDSGVRNSKARSATRADLWR